MRVPYRYSNVIMGIMIAEIIPIIIFFVKGNMISLISCILLFSLIGLSVIYKYGNVLYINGSNVVIKNMFFFEKKIPKKNIRSIYIHTEHIFLKDTIYMNVTTECERRTFHLGTLSSEKSDLLYDYLNDNKDGHIEIVTSA